MAAEFIIGSNDYEESDDDFSTMTMNTSIDGRPVKIVVQYEDPHDVLAVFMHLGSEESIHNMYQSMSISYEEKRMHDALNDVGEGKLSLEEMLSEKEE